MAESAENNRLTQLDHKVDELAQEMRVGFERIATVMGNLVVRAELERFVRREEWDERGRRVDGDIAQLRRDMDRGEAIDLKHQDWDFQRVLVQNAQRFWWVPVAVAVLKPELLHGLAGVLGYK
jgi:hypothetical protein